MSSRFPSVSNPTYKHSVVSLTLIQKTICPLIFRTSFTPHRTSGGDSHIKVMGILIVSLRGVKCRLWSRLKCLGRKVIVICPFRYRSGLCKNKFTKKCRDTDHNLHESSQFIKLGPQTLWSSLTGF